MKIERSCTSRALRLQRCRARSPKLSHLRCCVFLQGMDENLERQHSTDAAAVQAPAFLGAGEEGSRHGAKGLGMYAEAPALQLQIQKNREVAKQAAALAPVEGLQTGVHQVSLPSLLHASARWRQLCAVPDASYCAGTPTKVLHAMPPSMRFCAGAQPARR